MYRVGRASCPPHFFARLPSSVLILALALASRLSLIFHVGSGFQVRRPLCWNAILAMMFAGGRGGAALCDSDPERVKGWGCYPQCLMNCGSVESTREALP